MICPNCGAIIPDGNVYCDECGQEIQIVPDYNLLEDDVLPSILEEKPHQKKDDASPDKPLDAYSRSRMMKLSVILVILAVVVLVMVLSYMMLQRHLHSYEYLYEKAVQADEEKRYEEAIGYYNEILLSEITDDEKYSILSAIASDYYRLGDYSSAKEILYQIIERKPLDLESFEMLLKILQNERDYEAIELLTQYSTTDEAVALLDEYLILPPVFSETGGIYNDDIELSLTSRDGYDIYYTTDGTAPDENGILYEEPLELTDGTITVRAVCVTKDNTFGFEASETYTVFYENPYDPVIMPGSGAYSEPTFITIECLSEGVALYYAWDDDYPTVNSERYAGPIELPMGEHRLSVIAIDKRGLTSSVVKCDYVCYY